MKSYSKHQLRDYSTLFSRNEVSSWLRSNFTSLESKAKRYDCNLFQNSKFTYKDYLKYIYEILENNYPTEYIIKNEFLTEWLIPEIHKNNGVIFSEFRVGDSIADLVTFNGKSQAFEIKTEFDSDNRLESQLLSYKKAFNEVFLIIPESKLKFYSEYDESVGLIAYDIKKTKRFTVKRSCLPNEAIDPSTIMRILHSNEYKSIVKDHFGYLPEMTSFNQFEKCFALIKNIPHKILNNLFILYMKKRTVNNSLSARYYKEFNQISLALRMDKEMKRFLINNLNSRPKQFQCITHTSEPDNLS